VFAGFAELAPVEAGKESADGVHRTLNTARNATEKRPLGAIKLVFWANALQDQES
jgi:hypothetical protein